MLVVETVVRIRREHASGKAIKAIARDLRLSRKVVRKAIRAPDADASYERKEQHRPQTGPFSTRLEELLEPACRATLEQTSLPAWLPKRRWFAGKDTAIDSVRIAYGVRFGAATSPVLLSEIEVDSGGQTSRYQLPFGLIGEDQLTSALPQQLALSRVRRGRQVGLIRPPFVPADIAADLALLAEVAP